MFGGGFLLGVLFLGVFGGMDMFWFQLVVIVMGVVMFSAISYVILLIGKCFFVFINEYINLVLGWSWLMVMIMVNMIWCML